jgi:hypothetical protein
VLRGSGAAYRPGRCPNSGGLERVRQPGAALALALAPARIDVGRGGHPLDLDRRERRPGRRGRQHRLHLGSHLYLDCPLPCTGGLLITNDEVTAFHWADEGEINQLTSEAYAVRLLDAFRQFTTPAIRQHDGSKLLN